MRQGALQSFEQTWQPWHTICNLVDIWGFGYFVSVIVLPLSDQNSNLTRTSGGSVKWISQRDPIMKAPRGFIFPLGPFLFSFFIEMPMFHI